MAGQYTTSGWRPPTRPGAEANTLFNGSAYMETLSGTSVLPTALNLSAPFTIAAWAKATTVSGSASTGNILTGSSGSNGYALSVGGNTSHYGVTSFWDGANWDVPSSGTVWSSNTWYRVLVSVTGTTATFYLNGVQDGGTATISALSSYTGLRYVGSGTIGASPLWTGNIDDVTIWSRALSAAEARADHDLSLAGYPRVLIGPQLYVPAPPGGPFPWHFDQSMSGGFCELGLSC